MTRGRFLACLAGLLSGGGRDRRESDVPRAALRVRACGLRIGIPEEWWEDIAPFVAAVERDLAEEARRTLE